MADLVRTILSAIIFTYIGIGFAIAIGFHFIFQSGDPPPPITGEYLGEVFMIGLTWPIWAAFVFIVIAASAASH